MNTISLISCSKTKRPQASRAVLLYDSALFRKSLLYALSNSDAHYILSAKYGLLAPEEFIEPYELTLKTLSQQQKITWGDQVIAHLRRHLKKREEIIVLCGREYYRQIITKLKSDGYRLRFPLDDLSFGKRLRKLIELNEEEALNLAYLGFYRTLRALYIGQSGGRLLKECNGKLQWPKRGLYFFLNPRRAFRRDHFPRCCSALRALEPMQ